MIHFLTLAVNDPFIQLLLVVMLFLLAMLVVQEIHFRKRYLTLKPKPKRRRGKSPHNAWMA